MNILVVGLIVVVVCIFPVMITARKLNAGKSDLVDCIIAVVAGGFVSSIVVPIIPGAASSAFLATALSLAVTGVVYKFLLEATYITGFIIALIPAIIYFVLDVVFT